jgi:RimJ/RimL family protein N-acetyltransferase
MKRFLVGHRISLHALDPQHLAADKAYFSWLDDLTTDLHTERSRFPNTEERMLSYYKRACQNNDLVLLGIFENETTRHIGNVTLKDLNWFSRRGWLGYMIGEKNARGKGYATEAVLMMLYYAFMKLNLNRIFTTITESNTPSLGVAERAGFLREGLFREHMILGEEKRDVIAFGALRREWLASHTEAVGEVMDIDRI